jgi:hypothetical protein
VAAGVLVATQAHGADLVRPNIKPGLWEVSADPQVSGEMPIPEDQLARMSPEQRARLEAAIKSSLAKGVQHRQYKECMTPEKIARGFDIDKNGDDASCKRKVISSTPSEVILHDECDNPERKTVTDVHFEVKGGTQMSGTLKVVMTSNGKTMTVNSVVAGKWLGASCGNIKGAEAEK